MAKHDLADRPADINLSAPELLAEGYRDYQRYHVTLKGKTPVVQQRDILRGGKVVALLPIDLARNEVVLIRQFRLAAHLANGRGDLVEIVAGRIETGESLIEAVRRECGEEIGVTPGEVVELLSYLTTPGVTDEEVTVFAASVDASKVREGPLTAVDGEQLEVMRVSIDDALAALAENKMRGSPIVVALQWLALNRNGLAALLKPKPAR
jgi:ADP-ribose pyrophosphatase